jgi:RimJ/RimL family protein N-acetyltransferase
MSSDPFPQRRNDTHPADAPPEVIDLERLVLCRWRVTDAEEQAELVAGSVAHLTPFMGWAQNSGPEMSREFLERTEHEWAARTSFQYSMRLPGEKTMVGSCGLMARVGIGALEIGYWVALDHVRRGFATLSSAGLAAVGFGIPDIDRIEIHHDRANTVSERVPAKLGFTRLREVAVEPTSPAETGTHVIWVMERNAWDTSPGAQLLRAA